MADREGAVDVADRIVGLAEPAEEDVAINSVSAEDKLGACEDETMAEFEEGEGLLLLSLAVLPAEPLLPLGEGEAVLESSDEDCC